MLVTRCPHFHLLFGRVVQSEAETSLLPVSTIAGTFQAKTSKDGVTMPGVLASFYMELVYLARAHEELLSFLKCREIANPGHCN